MKQKQKQLNKLKDLLHTFEPDNIELALLLADGQGLPLRAYWDNVQFIIRSLVGRKFAEKEEDIIKNLKERKLILWGEEPRKEFTKRLSSVFELVKPIAQLIDYLQIVHWSSQYDELEIPDNLAVFSHLQTLYVRSVREVKLPACVENMHALHTFMLSVYNSELYDWDNYFPPNVRILHYVGNIDTNYFKHIIQHLPLLETVAIYQHTNDQFPNCLATLEHLHSLKLVQSNPDALVGGYYARLQLNPNFAPLADRLRSLDLIKTIDKINEMPMQATFLKCLQTNLPNTTISIK